jgi:hypothetical protein
MTCKRAPHDACRDLLHQACPRRQLLGSKNVPVRLGISCTAWISVERSKQHLCCYGPLLQARPRQRCIGLRLFCACRLVHHMLFMPEHILSEAL